MTRRRFSAAWLAMIAATLLLASGCVRVTADLTVSNNDTVTGDIVIAYPSTTALLFEADRDLAGLKDSYTSIEGAVERGYDQDGFSGSRIVFNDVDIVDFSAPDLGQAPITIVRDGDFIEVEGSFDFSGYDAGPVEGTDGFETKAASQDLGNMWVSVVLPGKILDTNGIVNELDNRVSWRLQLGQVNTLYATAESPVPTPDWVWWAGAGGLLGVAGLVWWLVARARSEKPSEPQYPGRVPPVTP